MGGVGGGGGVWDVQGVSVGYEGYVDASEGMWVCGNARE